MNVILVLVVVVVAVGFGAVLWRSYRRRRVPAYDVREYRDKPTQASPPAGTSGLGGPV